ncbi:hypothetical protein [Deinococcus fonticola]|uniref:hypothetical protein n=1 Tax=Deinococcus fonticola TaxID=2528713 RepID=UPI00142FA37D|nr:hypothetical protein [Deinococcus fonticola]
MKWLAALIISCLLPAASAEGLKFAVYPPKDAILGEPITFTVLLENTGKKAEKFNIYTCPVTSITSQWTRKVVGEIKACIEPLTDITIPPGGRHIQKVNYSKLLAFGPYKAVISLNDTLNGHKTTLTTFFTVHQAPQVVQQVVMPPVVLAEKPVTVQVRTRNISSKVFSQDLRLCGTKFLIRDRRGKTMFETPSTQPCTGDLRPTTLKPGESHLESWPLRIKLKPGVYEIQHWGLFGTPMTKFEIR